MSELSRRDAVKVIGAAAGAAGIAALPDVWEKSAVEASSLPRVSAASGEPTPTATPEILAVAITTPEPDALPYFNTLTPTILGTSTPGSLVMVTVDGLPALPAVSAPDGTWSFTTQPLELVNNWTRHSVEATATKPGATPAHAGPVDFLAWAPPQ